MAWLLSASSWRYAFVGAVMAVFAALVAVLVFVAVPLLIVRSRLARAR